MEFDSVLQNSGMKQRLENDDFVATRKAKGGKVKLGLVTLTYESDEEESSDDESDVESRLTPGQIRVEWYPSGRETKIQEQRAYCIDRTLLRGETVHRCADPNQKIGLVLDANVIGDIVILPKRQYIVKGVDMSRFAFVKSFDDDSTSCQVVYENWIGELSNVSQRVLLRSPKGYRCWLSTLEMDDVRDETQKKEVGCSFGEDQYYPGQPISLPMDSLQKAEWLQGFRPPERILRQIGTARKRIKFTIDKVQIEEIHLKFTSPLPGSLDVNDITPPDRIVRGDDIKKIRKIDRWDLNTARIGDRMLGRLEPSDVLITERDWQENLFRNFHGLVGYIDKDIAPIVQPESKSVSSCEAFRSEDTPRSSGCCQESDDVFFTASENSEHRSVNAELQGNESSEEWILDSDTEDGSGHGKSNAPNFTETKFVEPHGKNVKKIAHRVGGKILRRQALPVVRKKSRKESGNTERKQRKHGNPDVLGRSYVGEIIFLRSCLDVLWQDGVLEKRIPSNQLAYSQFDLDQHRFLPGSFVNMNPENRNESLENGYGIVAKADSEQRMATVSWYTFASGGIPVFLKEEDVSDYELTFHKDYEYLPGQCVMRVGDCVYFAEQGHNVLANIGQVRYVEVESGKVSVYWLDDNLESVWPTEIVCIFSSDMEESSAYDDDSSLWVSGSEESDDEWTTGSSQDTEEDSDTLRVHVVATGKQVLSDRAWKVLTETGKTMKKLLGFFFGRIKEDPDSIQTRVSVIGLVVNFHKQLLRNKDLDPFGRYSFEMTTRSLSKGLKAWLKTIDKKESGDVSEEGTSTNRNKFDIKKEMREESVAEDAVEEEKKKLINNCMAMLGLGGGDNASFVDFVSGNEAVKELKLNPTGKKCLAMVDLMICCLTDATLDLFNRIIEVAGALRANTGGDSCCSDLSQAPSEQITSDRQKEEDFLFEVTTAEVGGSPVGFHLLERAPDDHSYIGNQWKPNKMSPHFRKAVTMEMKILQTSLPDSIFVKGFEDRLDLYSCMMIGPEHTPYWNGIFLFDISLPEGYPLDPPLVYFKSFASEQFNPNLYQSGKVCVSLLGTWTGKASELWNPGSNLLQVFVSIQGLILNSEPYFNEAGYETRRSLPESLEKSRRYNELAVIRNMESLCAVTRNPPACFSSEIISHMLKNGHSLHKRVLSWMEGCEDCEFPLQPVSSGCKITAKHLLDKFLAVLGNLSLRNQSKCK